MHGLTAQNGATRKVPLSAARMVSGEFRLGDNGEEAKSAPIELLARTGKPIEHWWWGRVVHDLSGMHLHKSRLPIDYVHSPFEVIGYLNKFGIETGDLVASGALVPFKDSDRATEIIHKSRAGVPYEASIDFSGEGMVVEEVSAGASVEVNGYTFEGPGMVIREWPLRGVAVCPYGADMNTKTSLDRDGGGEAMIEVHMVEKETDVEKELTAEAKVEAVETENEATKAQAEADPDAVEADVEDPGKEAEADDAVDDSGQEETELTDAPDEDKARFARMVEEFGAEFAAAAHLDGLSYDEALARHHELLTAENRKLQASLDFALGESDAVVPARSEEADADPETAARAETTKQLTPILGENTAKFAASLKKR